MKISIADLGIGEQGFLGQIRLPLELSRPLMERGFLPGASVTVASAAPGGDPRVYMVDGTWVALREQTARRLILRGAR